MVLYRRWPNRAQLVLAAIRRHIGSISHDVPDTGDLREDVLTVVRRAVRRYEQIGPDVAHGLLAELPDLPDDVMLALPNVLTAILTRAATRGEIQPAGITPRIVALPADLVRHDLLLTRNPVSEAALAEIVDGIFLPLLGVKDS